MNLDDFYIILPDDLKFVLDIILDKYGRDNIDIDFANYITLTTKSASFERVCFKYDFLKILDEKNIKYEERKFSNSSVGYTIFPLVLNGKSTELRIKYKLKSNDNKLSSTQYENFIVFYQNKFNAGVDDCKNQKLSNIDDKLFQKILQHQDMATLLFKDNLKNMFGNNILEHFGMSMGKLSKFWTSMGGTNKTPKTDIICKEQGKRISVKKMMGSQFASGCFNETKATFYSVVKNPKIKLDKSIKKFCDDFFNEEHWSNINSDVKVNDVKRMIDDEIFSLIQTDNKTPEDIEKINNWLENSLYENKNIGCIVNGLIKNKQLSCMLSDVISKNSDFKYGILEEAIVGKKKFRDIKSKPNSLLLFNEDGTLILNEIDEFLINEYMNKTKFNVTFKNSSSIKTVVRLLI